MPCAVARLLEVMEKGSLGFNEWISFHVRTLKKLDSAPGSIKKSISRSGG